MKKYVELSDIEVVTKTDTFSHEVIGIEVEVDGRVLEIEALRSKKVPHGDFLPASVHVKGQKENTWSFQELKAIGFTGLAKLFRLEPKGHSHIDMIGLMDRNGKLMSVVPLSILGNSQLVNTEEYGIIYLGVQFQHHELIRLKSQLARQEEVDCQLTSAEQALLKNVSDLEGAEVKAEKSRREVARLERRKAILSRAQITVYTATGEKVRGLPVMNDEWEVLGNGQPAILLESYRQDTGWAGKPIEVFRVYKTAGGHVFKREVKTGLSLEPPKHQAISMAFKLFRLNGELATVPVVTGQQLEEMRQKMNSGTRVAVPEGADGKTFQVYSLEKGKSRPIGIFPSL